MAPRQRALLVYAALLLPTVLLYTAQVGWGLGLGWFSSNRMGAHPQTCDKQTCDPRPPARLQASSQPVAIHAPAIAPPDHVRRQVEHQEVGRQLREPATAVGSLQQPQLGRDGMAQLGAQHPGQEPDSQPPQRSRVPCWTVAIMTLCMALCSGTPAQPGSVARHPRHRQQLQPAAPAPNCAGPCLQVWVRCPTFSCPACPSPGREQPMPWQAVSCWQLALAWWLKVT